MPCRSSMISWKNGEGLPGLSSVPTTVWLPRFAMICSAAVSAENVIVAGFDGISSSYIMQPQLTTCDSNPEELAELVMERILSFDPKLQPPEEPVVLTHTYRTVLTESCGCSAVTHNRFSALKSLQRAKALSVHENSMYYAIDQLLEEKDLYSFLEKVGEMILPDSALYLNRSLLEANPDMDHMPDHPEEDLIMIPYCRPGETPALRKVHLRDMPLPSRESSGITILNIVHSDVRVCGYYAAHTDSLADDSQLIKRLSDVMNLIASVQLGRMRQLQLVARLENNLFVDSITGLSNLKGLSRWYENYVKQENARDRMLSASVYVISRYSWICETYGIAEAEEVIRTFRVAAAGGELDDDDLDFIRDAMMQTYWDAKQYNQRFANHRYQKGDADGQEN